MMRRYDKKDVLFWVGVIGILFYVVSPVLFPDTPNLRQPELLPVYTLMLGLGHLLKGDSKNVEVEKESENDKEPISDIPRKQG